MLMRFTPRATSYNKPQQATTSYNELNPKYLNI
jgi:hypothetical protein